MQTYFVLHLATKSFPLMSLVFHNFFPNQTLFSVCPVATEMQNQSQKRHFSVSFGFSFIFLSTRVLLQGSVPHDSTRVAEIQLCRSIMSCDSIFTLPCLATGKCSLAQLFIVLILKLRLLNFLCLSLGLRFNVYTSGWALV